MKTASQSRPKDRTLEGWAIAFGLLAFWAGGQGIGEWSYLALSTRLAYGIFLTGGIILVGSGVWRLSTGRMGRASAWLLLLVSLGLAMNLALGLWRGTIPCFTPG